MKLSDDQIKALKQSIDELTKEISNIDSRLKALCEKLGVLAKAIETSSPKIR
jgi:prefoldin subunit 5